MDGEYEKNKNCTNCPFYDRFSQNFKTTGKNIIKFSMNRRDIGDYSREDIEKKLNNEAGIQDAVFTEDELLVFYDDILISPEKLKEILS